MTTNKVAPFFFRLIFLDIYFPKVSKILKMINKIVYYQVIGISHPNFLEKAKPGNNIKVQM